MVAVLPATLFATEREILDTTLEVEHSVERDVEERLLQQMLDMTGPAGRATLGVEPTLAALWADMVQTLVVASGVHSDGSECLNCQRLARGGLEDCPVCGKAMRHVHDLFHRAMVRAVERSGGVEVMHGAAARRLGDLGDGLGALLRYPSTVPRLAT